MVATFVELCDAYSALVDKSHLIEEVGCTSDFFNDEEDISDVKADVAAEV